jgi:hypothetical protein
MHGLGASAKIKSKAIDSGVMYRPGASAKIKSKAIDS